jgi:hypothetical protein
LNTKPWPEGGRPARKARLDQIGAGWREIIVD